MDMVKKSNIFDNYEHYCVDIIQSLIILPLEEQKYTNIDQSYKTFIEEFIKIEQEIGNPFYNLYILKGIVDVARDVRLDYTNNGIPRKNALKYFERSIHERINCVADFCNPKKIHYEKMLCSLLCLSKNIEGVLYDVIDSRMKDKTREYNKIPLQSSEQIYGAIEVNIPDKYQFNNNTTVFVMDCIKKTCKKLKLSEENCNDINKTHVLGKGTFLYDLYKL